MTWLASLWFRLTIPWWMLLPEPPPPPFGEPISCLCDQRECVCAFYEATP